MNYPGWYVPLLENKARAEISFQTGSMSGSSSEIQRALWDAIEGKLVCESCKQSLPNPGHSYSCAIALAYYEIFRGASKQAETPAVVPKPPESLPKRPIPPQPPNPTVKRSVPFPLARGQ